MSIAKVEGFRYWLDGERVSSNLYNKVVRMEEVLQEIADHGTRQDMTPTTDASAKDGLEMYLFLTRYFGEGIARIRKMAKEVL